MKTNEFIREHITVDSRERISKKLRALSEKYIEFGKYLNLVQKEQVSIILLIMQKEDFFFKGMVTDLIKNVSYNHYINTLLADDFIEQFRPEEKILNEVSNVYNSYVAGMTKYYRLTKKGKDFLSIDFINEYLNTEYKDLLESIK